MFFPRFQALLALFKRFPSNFRSTKMAEKPQTLVSRSFFKRVQQSSAEDQDHLFFDSFFSEDRFFNRATSWIRFFYSRGSVTFRSVRFSSVISLRFPMICFDPCLFSSPRKARISTRGSVTDMLQLSRSHTHEWAGLFGYMPMVLL